MQYDPIKDRFGRLVAGRTWATRLFFFFLQMVFLRSWYVRRELRRAVQRAGSRLRDGERCIDVLDAGTGFGQFSWWMAQRFERLCITAVDVKEDYLQEARRRFAHARLDKRVTFKVDDLVALQADGPFDLILSVDVMEHIEEDERVFSHFFRVLRPEGQVIINTPSDQGGSDVHTSDGESFISEHVRDGYARADLRAKLERAGFHVDRIDYTYGMAGSLAWKLAVKVPMRMLGAWFGWVVLLPLWYAAALPVVLVLHAVDVKLTNKTGTGLIAVAHRPPSS
ncbi:MAG: methyltransferase type 11 [Bacteroidetes bacterium CG12_big_fil_rev_8_21_14_0_65_60_17]|nr:MAG: methyltransferase type 11 [Bacteroidetes bacterium CG12_big_fil_rev_8_21_14_0_65_60_17]